MNAPGSRIRFILKTLLPALLAIGLYIAAFFIVLIPQFEETVHGRKREMIRELTHSAWGILSYWHQQEAAGLLTRQRAQQEAVSQVEQLRYGADRKDYFWITDTFPVMVMHPYRPDLNGQDLSDMRDSSGKLLFVEMARVVRSHGEGYVDYTWQWKDDSSRIVPKVSFVKGFEPWGWIVGTGIYVEDVRAENAALEQNTINISIGITVVIASLLSFLAFQNFRTERERLRVERQLHESREQYRALVESSTEGLIMVIAGQEVICNKSMYLMLGYPEGGPPSVPWQELFVSPPKAELFDFERFVPVAGKGPGSEQIQTSLRGRDGSAFPVLVIISYITILGKEGIVLSVKDLSRHHADDEASEEEKGLGSLAATGFRLGLIRTAPSREARIVTINGPAVDLLGASGRDQVLTSALGDWLEYSSQERRLMESLVDEGSVRRRIVDVRRADGTRGLLAVSGLRVLDHLGTPEAFLFLLEDAKALRQEELNREELLTDLHASVLLLDRPVSTLLTTYPSCDMQTTAAAAATIMSGRNKDAVIVTGPDAPVLGVVTDQDIRNRILAERRPLETAVHRIMSAPAVSLPESAVLLDLLVLFLEKEISHVVILRADNEPVGIVHARDLQSALYSSALGFLRRVESLNTLEELRGYKDRMNMAVHTLIDRGSGLAAITRLTAHASQAIARRIVALAIADLGPPPVSFALLTMGSEGRSEPTLLTDQDNAIVYDDPVPDQADRVREYFCALGTRICSDLADVGYRKCPGNNMASNPHWCQPLSVWKGYFTTWITTANPQDILDVKIFYDFRTMYGSEEIVSALRSHVQALLKGNDRFFLYLAESLLKWELPEGTQKLKSRFDIKRVILPLVDAARLYALRHQIAATNTIERITRLGDSGHFSRAWTREFREVYSFLMGLRFRNQRAMIADGRSPMNDVDPADCSDVELTMLKKSIAHVEVVREKVSHDFRGIGTR